VRAPSEYRTIGERATNMIGHHWYGYGVGFGRVVACDLIWANVAHLTIRLHDGRLVCPIKATTI